MKLNHLLLLTILILTGCSAAGTHPISHTDALAQTVPDPDGQWKGVDCTKIKVVPRSEYERNVQCHAAQLPPLDPAKRDHFGELYNPKKYLECKLRLGRGFSDCDVYKLRRAENPEYWPYPEIAKPKWPDAPKDSVYKADMTSQQYFEALCKAEAGEFIYRTVDNVEGVYQVRPRAPQGSDENMQDRFVLEDPYGYTDYEAEEPQAIFVNPPWKKYSFFEQPLVIDASKESSPHKVVRYSGRDQHKNNSMAQEIVNQSASRYGFTWRGIKRPHDREMGIAGGELIVVDLQTNEILGLRRGFIHTGTYGGAKTWWLSGGVCPRYPDRNHPKDVDFTYWFISKILIPAAADESISR